MFLLPKKIKINSNFCRNYGSEAKLISLRNDIQIGL